VLLCIDVGNTETKLVAFSPTGVIAGTWRVVTSRRRTDDEYGVLFAAFFTAANFVTDDVDAIVVSSVVPIVDRPLAEGCAKYFGVRPSFFTAESQRSIPIRTERPRELGADLAAAAIGTLEAVGAPAIFVNFGTATTFGAIDHAGAYVGTVIAPGIQVAFDALVGRAAKLPQVALEAPASPIGRDTVSSLQSGVVYGAVGQTEGIVSRMRAELGREARVIASGGLAEIVARETPIIERVEPHLVPLGLRAHYLATHPFMAPSLRES
jgi:type III pantothenate kinase